jgi:hypothetical protein
MVFISKEGQVD